MSNRVLVAFDTADIPSATDIIPHILETDALVQNTKLGTPILPHVLSTKYYTSKLEFVFLPLSTKHVSATLSEQGLDFSQQAIILAYNKNTAKITEFGEYAGKTGGEFETCLCVCTGDSGASTGIMDWCLNNGYEWVGKYEHNEDEVSKQGRDRVIEALECTMWREMEKPGEKKELKDTVNEIQIEEPIDEEDLFQQTEDMDALLEAISKLRTEGGQLSHDDRKKQAEKLATQLFMMLGDDEDDDEE
jgi:hypothetical protein